MSEAKAKKRAANLADMMPPAAAAGFMNRHQVCKALGGVSIRRLATMQKTGEFPMPDYHLGRNPRWSVPLFNEWVEATRAKPQPRT